MTVVRVFECVIGREMSDDPVEIMVGGGAVKASHDVSRRAGWARFGGHGVAPFHVRGRNPRIFDTVMSIQ